MVGLTWLIYAQSGRTGQLVFQILEAFLLFSALSISLGNWMDRQTMIRLGVGGVEFENGLRKSRLKWEEIDRIQVFPSAWGKKVQVIGAGSHFSFRTLGEVNYMGESRGRLGFAEGELILQRILESSHLGDMKTLNSGYYYARD